MRIKIESYHPTHLDTSKFKHIIEITESLMTNDPEIVLKQLYRYYGDNTIKIYQLYLNTPKQVVKNLHTFLTDWDNNKKLWSATLIQLDNEEMRKTVEFLKSLVRS